MVTPYQIIIVVSALFLSAFFSGIEIAFLTADKLGVRLEGEQKSISGRVLNNFFKRPDHFISTILLGNTIVLVIYGNYMAQILGPLLHAYLPTALNNKATLLALQTLLSTLGILVVAEFIPKSISLLGPSRFLFFFALPTAAIAYALYPLVVITTIIAKYFIIYILRKEYREERPVFGLTDLHTFLRNTLHLNKEMPGNINARIISNLLTLKQVRVRDCMIPRTEIVAVSIKSGIEGVKKAVIKSDHTRILVYRHDIDDIIGYCHAKELFKRPMHIESILRPIIIVPATNLISEVMTQLTKEDKSLALVVDEFGGTSGMVSMGDIIEEIVGEIQNEHDAVTLIEQKLESGAYLLSARHEIDYLNTKYGWDLPQGNYDTLGGFIIHLIERIPDLNETVKSARFTFTIVSLADTRIGTVKLSINNASKKLSSR